MRVRVLSGGAAQGLVNALAGQFKAQTGCDIDGAFMPVGGVWGNLVTGRFADLLIVTRELVEGACREWVVPGTAVDIGTVQTGVAVRSGDPALPLNNSADLHGALLAADEIYLPDPGYATAGIHFLKVLDRLALRAKLTTAQRLRTFETGGAAAMRGLAAATGQRLIGCTQVTEILVTPGVMLVGSLPKGFELATVYTAAVCTRAALPEQAHALAALLAGEEAREARQRVGFV